MVNDKKRPTDNHKTWMGLKSNYAERSQRIYIVLFYLYKILETSN